MKKLLSANEFTVPIRNPANRMTVVCVNIYKDGRFNMNGKLSEKLGGKKLKLAFTPDAAHFMLQEGADPDAVSFPKNGSKKLEDVLTLLNQRKIPLPARYDVWYNDAESFWQGDMVENPTQSHPAGHRNSARK